MNVIAALTARIEEYRAENKNPCKNYATEAAAEKATAKMAQDAANYFYKERGVEARPAQYVVFYNAAWGRWVGCIDLTELMKRNTSTGGYVGDFCKGFFTF
jgi:hypothetical protein